MKSRTSIGLACMCVITVCHSRVATAGTLYDRAGWTAELDGMFHNVSGVVTIVDETTLQVDNFYYDGGGLSVYFYLGATDTHASFVVGLQIGPPLLGTVFSDDSLTLTLPPGETLDDYGAIAVWCVPAQADFGSGSFRFDPADANNDGYTDLDDHALLERCLNGPGEVPTADGLTASQCRIAFDTDDDDDVDAQDFADFQVVFGQPPSQTAQYQLTFTATWSQATHPQDFPSSPHFSGLIGGTHNEEVRFWEVGALASQGIEDMAELGSKAALTTEVNAAITAGQAGERISGGNINPSPGSVSVTFTVTQQFPLVTMTSMIAPSPDWFVAVDSLRLFRDNRWLGEIVVPLEPYDAGTDDGLSFTSPNADTDPPEPIAPIVGYPFLNGETQAPVGTFTFTRID